MTSFDALAATYDADFTQTQIGQYLRAKVNQRLLLHYSENDHVLELGCGTGEDARFLGECGIHVTGIDASKEMLKEARHKTAHMKHIDLKWLALDDIGQLDFYGYDGAFSNFGALNCLADWKPLATRLAEVIKPGGVVGLGIMARNCLWETLWHGAHLDFKTALRRRRGSNFDGLKITYPTVQRIENDFSPYFKRVYLMPLGLFLPPSDVFGVIEKRPRLLKRLTQLEERFGDKALFAQFADHYWIELQRK